ncbi:nuclear transport factor 2 family protein [Enterovibrio calviensis]|uniref:hypothetical protein n=1 Tax=Enterovibrio calviensis TaxID=91359 RepID=UPI000486FE03|nr:hypothetical protein [Enterovibrio calviensis]
MNNKECVRELWERFSQGDYQGSRHLMKPNINIVWPTSRECYENADEYLAVNEVFGEGWTFEILSLEETTSGKVISVTYVSCPQCKDSFYATSICQFEDNLISHMETFWAFQDQQPEWRKGLSHVY